ncbi:MAG: phage tail protein [Caulobacteraceae bacterium]
MADPFIGQIIQAGFNFAPPGWLMCSGQTLSIAQNAALFSLLGTQFGGDGVSTFKIPNLNGRIVLGPGTNGGPTHVIGELSGVESVVLTASQLPSHTHAATFSPTGGGGSGPLNVTVTLNASTVTADLASPTAGALLGAASDGTGAMPQIYVPAGSGGQVALGGVSAAATGGGGITGGTVAITPTGANAPVPVLPPYLVIPSMIATSGIFPSRP